MTKLVAGMLLALAMVPPVAARDLPVPADKGWRHARSGIVLTARLAGMSRTALSDATDGEFDVTAQFATPGDDQSATIYLFHPAIPDVPMWFDRARTALERRDIFRNAAPATADPVAFAAGGGASASAIKQVYALAGGRARSTALAVIPVGEWLAVIRLTSNTLIAPKLDATLTEMIDAIRWPASTGTSGPVAVPVQPCTAHLDYPKAKVVRSNGSDVLTSLMIRSAAVKAAAKKDTAPPTPVVWCREEEAGPTYAAYRTNDDMARYVLALGDAGRVIHVAPSLMGQVDKTGTYAVTLEDVDGTVVAYPSFSALPRPAKALELVMSGKATARMQGSNITLDPGVR